MQTCLNRHLAPLADFAAKACMRGGECGPAGVRVVPGVLAEYLIHARRVCAAASIDLLCAVPFMGAAFFIPATLQRRCAAV
ncbi:hypothetical protein [Pseudogulbenkiania sp. MAI-1]|uniref:hypothetical protein n=1 Tax=Pseudogulbenkiania sp. MAI-1 TaxID=990370 RepID=UPI00045E8043|nr:hypothetical protein [Pseudogulbenkiania sp. MAI-1]